MSAARDYIVVLMVLFAMMTDIGAKGKMLNNITEGYLVAYAHVYCNAILFPTRLCYGATVSNFCW